MLNSIHQPKDFNSSLGPDIKLQDLFSDEDILDIYNSADLDEYPDYMQDYIETVSYTIVQQKREAIKPKGQKNSAQYYSIIA